MTSNRKIALITGAGSGIGKATAHALLKEGYTVVLAGRRLESLQQTAAESGSADTLAVQTDVSDPVSIKALFAAIKETYGRLDLLFNNAGLIHAGLPIDEVPFEQWKAVIDINLTGAFLCTQESIKIMKAQNPQGGRIINNGSISAHVPRIHSAPYTASKHAITGLTRSTSLDCRPYNIACGQIDIGNAREPAAMESAPGAPQANGQILKEPAMDVADVARAVVYMASLPLEANVQFMTVTATTMPYIGRG